MTRNSRVPRLCKRKSPSTGRTLAYATFNGRTVSFGPDGPEARQEFEEFLTAWLAAGRRLPDLDPDDSDGITLADLFRLYLDYLDDTGRYTKAGKRTSQRQFTEKALDEVEEWAGHSRVGRFGEGALLQHRDRLEKNKHLTRQGINRKVNVIRAAFCWGRGRGLVPKVVCQDLKSVEPLTKAEAGNRRTGCPKRIPSIAEVRKAIAVSSRQVGAMLRIQLLTGMRPGEVCSMKFSDIRKVEHKGERFGDYRVGGAKTEHHGYVTRYALHSDVLAIIDQFRRLGGGYVFRPCDVMLERGVRLRAGRKTPITKQTRDRDRGPNRLFGDRYDPITYRQAVTRACKAAGVERFVPHALRHVHASWAANHAALGAGAAAVALNHVSRSTTERYVHPDDLLRFKVAITAARELAGQVG